MAVRITKPQVNIREKLAELERPIGLNGSALMKTETPQEAFSLIGAGRKNLIINGNFKISQRGNYTSSTTVGSSGYFLDRWLTIYGTGSTIQHKKNQVLPNGDITDSALATVTTTGYTGFEQFIEFPEVYSGQTFTVSFWIKTNYYLSEINIYNGSGYMLGSTNGGTLNENSGQWKFYSKTFTMPSSGNTMFRIEFWTGSGSTPVGSYIELAQVQVERGKGATPFEYRSTAEELALCMRYYENSYPVGSGIASSLGSTMIGGTFSWITASTGWFAGQHSGSSQFRVVKRGVPVMRYWDYAGNLSKVGVLYGASNVTVNAGSPVSGASTKGFYPDVNTQASSNLFVYWEADAEL